MNILSLFWGASLLEHLRMFMNIRLSLSGRPGRLEQVSRTAMRPASGKRKTCCYGKSQCLAR